MRKELRWKWYQCLPLSYSWRVFLKSVQASSWERHKSTQRTLFLLFEHNYCFPSRHQYRAASEFSHNTLYWKHQKCIFAAFTNDGKIRLNFIPILFWIEDKDYYRCLFELNGLQWWSYITILWFTARGMKVSRIYSPISDTISYLVFKLIFKIFS